MLELEEDTKSEYQGFVKTIRNALKADSSRLRSQISSL